MPAICNGLWLRRQRACMYVRKNHSATYVLGPSVVFLSVMPSLQLMPYLGQVHLRTIDHSNNVSDPRETRYASIELYFLL